MLRATIPILAMLALIGCDGSAGTDSGDTDGSDTDTNDTGLEITQDDADGDSIIDVHEGDEDFDEDGDPNYLDTDSDGDTINDRIEAGDTDPLTLPVDSDGDGMPDYLDLDSDNNCLTDKEEKGGTPAVDTDGDGVRDYADADNDGDGILDEIEIQDTELCDPPDTDGDGTYDFMDLDSDGDGIGDAFEWGGSIYDPDPRDTDEDGIPDYLDTDSDGDGFLDSSESGVTSIDQEPRDTDGDGLYDFQDTDADGDGLSDADEVSKYKTDPYDFDTDGDGFSDGGEILAGTDPLDSGSVIDGVYVEVGERTEVEETFTFQLRIQRGDIALLTDTTCSMGGTLTAAKKVFTSILTEVQATFEDVAGASGGFDDYAYGSFGSAGTDKPFYVNTPITSDFSEVQKGVDSLSTHSGADGPESGYEAYYQSATGAGYDQDCDGSYDSSTDVYPFVATSSDPFGGKGGEHYDPSLPDAGTRGGFGFRDYSLPVVVLIQDNYMRDADLAGTVSYGSTPGGCPLDAGHSDTVAAFLDLGGYPITINTSSGTAGLADAQARQLAFDTNAVADMNGDGEIDPTDNEDLLVTVLNQSASGYETELAEYVATAIDQLVAAIKFSSVELVIDGDEYGFVTGIDPTSYTDIEADSTTELDFELSFRGVVAATTEDQLFKLTLNVIGDGTTLLDTYDIIVVVPGTAY